MGGGGGSMSKSCRASTEVSCSSAGSLCVRGVAGLSRCSCSSECWSNPTGSNAVLSVGLIQQVVMQF